jgi:DNA-directed RNA polymerase specialized sigma24 family protein
MPKNKPKDYQDWQGDGGLEVVEANPDVAADNTREPTAAEEAMRHLLDHPLERVELLGTFGEGVFMTVFVDGLTYREAGKRLGKSKDTVWNESVKVRAKIKDFVTKSSNA